MKKSLHLFAAALFVFQSAEVAAQCADAASIYSFEFDGRTYEIIKENKNWAAAAACAVERGGYLAEVNSAEEQAAIFAAVSSAGIDPFNTIAQDGGNSSYVWLGGNDIVQEGKWIWDGNNDAQSVQFWQGTVLGSAVGGLYNNWGDEPDNSAAGTGQDALGLSILGWPLGDAGEWNDVQHTNALYYVVEYDALMSTGNFDQRIVSIYPNPAGSHIFIAAADVEHIIISNAIGQQVRSITAIDDAPISLEGLEQGVYFIRLQFTDGTLAVKKIIKE